MTHSDIYFRRRFNKKGFTLIEVIGSILIMTMALVPAMQLIPAILKTRMKIEYNSNIVFLAENKMEEVKDRILTNFDLEEGYSEDPSTFPAPFEEYSYSVTDDMDTWLKTVSVSVWHSDEPGYTVTLSTQAAKRVKPN